VKIKKRSPKKKAPIEADEIQGILRDLSSRVLKGIVKHRLAALASMSLLIILIIAIGVYSYLSRKWDREASALERSAYDHYIEGDYQRALSLYQKLISEYPRSSSVPVAMYYSGNSYMGLGQLDQAIQTYLDLIERDRGSVIIRPLAYMNLGYAYMGKKDYSNAISAFEEASRLKDSLVADRAVYEIARAYEISGDMVSAMEKYRYLVQVHPSSPWGQMASSKLNKAQAVVPDTQPQKGP